MTVHLEQNVVLSNQCMKKADLVAHAPQPPPPPPPRVPRAPLLSAMSRSPPCLTCCKPPSLLFTLPRMPSPDRTPPPSTRLSGDLGSCPCSTALTRLGCIQLLCCPCMIFADRQLSAPPVMIPPPGARALPSSVTTLRLLWALLWPCLPRILLWPRAALSPVGAA